MKSEACWRKINKTKCTENVKRKKIRGGVSNRFFLMQINGGKVLEKAAESGKSQIRS